MINFSKKHSLPITLQAESAECGLACMAMIASYHGYDSDLSSLRNKYGSSARGATLQSLIDLAESLHLTPRALRAELEDLSRLSTPIVLHWNFNHFVVLKEVKDKTIVIHDPAVGVRTYSLAEVGKKFTGIVLELSPRNDFAMGSDRSALKLWDFWRGIKGLTSSMVQILVLSLLVQIFALASPFYMQMVVDEVLVKHDSDLLLVLGIGFAGLTLISVATKALRGFSAVYLTSQFSFNMSSSVMHHIIRLPLEYFQKRHLGDVVSRFESLKPIQNFITSASISIIIDGLLAITTLAMILTYSPTLTVVVVFSVGMYGIFRVLQFQPLRNCNHENITSHAKLDSLFMETIRSLQSIKFASRESQREAAWSQKLAHTISSGAHVGRLTVSYEAVNGTLTGLEYVLVIFLGASEVLNGSLTIGMLYAFLAFRSHFSTSVISIIDQLMQYKMVGLHLERLADITQSEQEEGLRDQGKFSIPVIGKIDLISIYYGYPSSKAPIIDGLSVSISKGNFVALYGPSGVGKSTLLKIMMGLIDLEKGDFLVDGQEIKNIGLRSYRTETSAVTQEDSLFSGSLKDNITFFDLSPDPKKIVRVAKLAEIHNEILKMSMGYESLIGDMGVAMSQGQQQRLLIARALYSEPKILFLDEGTAHIDEEKERKIMKNIQSLKITCIFVTHNRNLLSFADKVIHWNNKENSSTPEIHEK